ncbi:MAG: hypothetical protein AAB866_02130 [Patescibacteria group bacterium]
MKKRYWLIGGLIFSGVVLVSIILLSFGDKTSNILDSIILPALFVEIIAMIPLGVIAGGLLGLKENIFFTVTGELGTGVPTLLGLSFLIIIWFVIGAFFGWIYGKIKNRKVGNQNNIPRL